MAQLFFKYGTMFSGKTIDLIKVYSNYETQGKKVTVLKPKLDTRDEHISTRLGITIECTHIDDYVYEDTDCILVDEAQFLTKDQVMLLRDITINENTPVICYGLKNDFQNEMFEGTYHLLLQADKLEEIKTVCQYCNKKATMNKRLSNSDEKIKLGHDYAPVCAYHYRRETC